MSDKPPLLWHSNTPWSSTGYGSQTALFARKLVDHYNLAISAFYGLEGNVIHWDKGIPVLPGIGQTYGNETIGEHVRTLWDHPRQGLVVTLMDVWVLNTDIWREFNVASWVPVDHEPAPAPVANFFHNSGAVPIAMSRFGQEQLADLNPLYVPHGVDTSAYKPLPKAQARKDVGLAQDAFLVGMVAANKGNPSRKCFAEAFEAFQRFHETHPDARLYLHTEVTGRFQGVNLLELMDNVGLPREVVVFADQYRAVHMPFPWKTMAKLYSSMDVLLCASAGEGFGIPVIEAQACGVPVIVSDFSAQPELCGAGWLVEGRRTYTAIGSWQFHPAVDSIVEALESVYATTEAERVQLSKDARTFVEDYDADKVFTDYMLPALSEAQARFSDRSPVELVAA